MPELNLSYEGCSFTTFRDFLGREMKNRNVATHRFDANHACK